MKLLDRVLLDCDFVPLMAFKPDFECSLLVVVVSAHEHLLQVLDNARIDAVSHALPFEEVGGCLSEDHARNAVTSSRLSLSVCKGQAVGNVTV